MDAEPLALLISEDGPSLEALCRSGEACRSLGELACSASAWSTDAERLLDLAGRRAGAVDDVGALADGPADAADEPPCALWMADTRSPLRILPTPEIPMPLATDCSSGSSMPLSPFPAARARLAGACADAASGACVVSLNECPSVKAGGGRAPIRPVLWRCQVYGGDRSRPGVCCKAIGCGLSSRAECRAAAALADERAVAQ